MDGVLFLFVGIIVLLLFDLAAVGWGVDSRADELRQTLPEDVR